MDIHDSPTRTCVTLQECCSSRSKPDKPLYHRLALPCPALPWEYRLFVKCVHAHVAVNTRLRVVLPMPIDTTSAM